jgi:hypothetical protein
MKRIYFFIVLILILYIPVSRIIPRWSYFTDPYYTELAYKSYERAFDTSQYRQKIHPSIIPDEIVFSYAAGAYLRGMDPILVNSEHTPLGKYFLGLWIYLIHNDRFPTLIFAVLSGLSIWLLSKNILGNGVWSLLPLLLVTFDRLFMQQLDIAPLLDILQLPFIYFTLYAFSQEIKHDRYLWTSIWIGIVIASKTVVPGILLVFCMTCFFLLQKQYKSLYKLYVWLPISLAILVVSYTRTFMNGYSLWDFLKFQKWIFDYQGSKLIYPFSSLRLLLFNQWQTWWEGNKVIAANDWSILWPVSTLASVVTGILFLRMKKIKPELLILILWVGVYQAFLCLGVVSSRFFIPLLPAQYILTIMLIQYVYMRCRILI